MVWGYVIVMVMVIWYGYALDGMRWALIGPPPGGGINKPSIGWNNEYT